MSEQFYAARLAEAQEEIVRLKEELTLLKERLRPHDPETELPPDRQFVLVMDRSRDPDGMTCSFFHLANYFEGKWFTLSGWRIDPVAWWPLPEQQKGDQ